MPIFNTQYPIQKEYLIHRLLRFSQIPNLGKILTSVDLFLKA